MFILNSPLSQFEVTNLIGIFAPILGQLNINLTNLALYTFLIIIIACLGLITIPLVFFSGRAGKIIDTVAKLVVIEAA
jgi:hypothetical protein